MRKQLILLATAGLAGMASLAATQASAFNCHGGGYGGGYGYSGYGGYGYSPYYGGGYYCDEYDPYCAGTGAYYYGDTYQNGGYVGDDGVAYCMRRFRTYDPQSGTYVGKGGRRIACP